MLLHLSMVCQTSSLQSNPYASLHLQACLTTNDSRPLWQTLYNQVVLGVKTNYSVSSQHKSPTSELPLGKILSLIPLIQLLISCTLNGTLTQQERRTRTVCLCGWMHLGTESPYTGFHIVLLCPCPLLESWLWSLMLAGVMTHVLLCLTHHL